MNNILTADKKSVTGEDSLVAAIFDVIAYTVLSVAGRVQCPYFDVLANVESRVVQRGSADLGAVFAADDGYGVLLQLLFTLDLNL